MKAWVNAAAASGNIMASTLFNLIAIDVPPSPHDPGCSSAYVCKIDGNIVNKQCSLGLCSSAMKGEAILDATQ